MSRTETCNVCGGSGEYDDGLTGIEPCPICGGNGYTTTDVGAADMAAALEADGEKLRQLTGEDHGPFNDGIAPLLDAPADLDFSIEEPPAPTRRMTNSTWRILEEQRVSALETVADCDARIAELRAKRDDAQRAAAMCAAGQKGAE